MSSRAPSRRTHKKIKRPSRPRPQPGLASMTGRRRPYRYRQHASTITLTQTSTDLLGALNFTLSQLTNASHFTAIYDQYKVEMLEFQLRPQANSTTLTTVSIVPRLVTVIDLDDSNTPGSIAELEEYANCMVSYNRPLTRKFTPGILSAIWDGSTMQPAGSDPPRWIDCASNAIPHFGLKIGLESAAPTQTALQVWRIDVFVSISFRSVR